MELQVTRNSPKPLYKQIADYYRELIENNILKHGELLPNQRELADHLGVNRSTISNAYSELWSSGLIYTKQGRGTEVNSPKHTLNNSINWQLYNNKNQPTLFKTIYRKIEQAALIPSNINFATGNLSLDSFGIIDIRKYHNGNIDKNVFSDILDHLYNIQVKKENLILTGGYFQAVFLIISTFLKKDDVVVVERPSIFYHHQILKEIGVRIIPIEMDDKGLLPIHLESLSRKYQIKMLFCQPSFQNPTGTLLPLHRRKKLLNICKANRIPIVETLSNEPLYHKVMGPPSLYSLAEDKSMVISVGGFEELLGEGIKMGWIITPNNSYETLSFRKHELGLSVSPLEQKIVGSILKQENLKDYLQQFRNELHRRKNKMFCLLNKEQGDLIKIYDTQGGKDLWCKILSQQKEEAVFEKCLENGVVIMPGSFFGVDSSFIKLSFAVEELHHISLGISKLINSITEKSASNYLN